MHSSQHQWPDTFRPNQKPIVRARPLASSNDQMLPVSAEIKVLEFSDRIKGYEKREV